MKLLSFFKDFWSVAVNFLPVVLFLLMFQFAILKKPLQDVKTFVFGLILSTIGLFIFIYGINASIIPLGDSIGSGLVRLDNKMYIILFAVLLGYTATLVEPALRVLTLQAEEISVGAIPKNLLLQTVAVGFALGMGLGVARILMQIPASYIFIPLLVIIGVLILFAPQKMVSLAFDCASASTGPVNIPLNIAIAVGLSKIVSGSDPLLHGFGLIGMTSLGTVITVLSLGILSVK